MCLMSYTIWMTISPLAWQTLFQCQSDIDSMLQTCQDLGFVMNPRRSPLLPLSQNSWKTFIDCLWQQALIDPDHFQDFIIEIKAISCSITERTTLSSICKLQFMCRLCHTGHGLFRCMINKSKKTTQLHHQ